MNEQQIIDEAIAPINAGLTKLRSQLKKLETRRKALRSRIRAFEAAKAQLSGRKSQRRREASGISMLAFAFLAIACSRQPWGAELEPTRLSEARGYLHHDWTYHVILRWRCPDYSAIRGEGENSYRWEFLTEELRQAGFEWALAFTDGTPIAGGGEPGHFQGSSYDGEFCRLEVAESVVRVDGGRARLEVAIDRMPPALEGKKAFLVLERDRLEAKYDEPLESIKHSDE